MSINDRPPEGPTNVYIKRHGKRFKATYCFFAKRVTCIISAEEATALGNDPRYCLRPATR